MESTIHNVNQPSSSTESEEENRERREKATQAEPASVYKDTAPGRVLFDVQEGILTIRVGDQQVKFNVVNALKDPDDVQSCQIIVDIKEKTRPTNAALKDEILKDNEDGEEEEIKLLCDRIFEQSNWSNRSTTKIEPLLEESSMHELETKPTHPKHAYLREVIMYFIVSSALNLERDKGSNDSRERNN